MSDKNWQIREDVGDMLLLFVMLPMYLFKIIVSLNKETHSSYHTREQDVALNAISPRSLNYEILTLSFFTRFDIFIRGRKLWIPPMVAILQSNLLIRFFYHESNFRLYYSSIANLTMSVTKQFLQREVFFLKSINLWKRTAE